MRSEYIIKQANQIASFYESMPDSTQATRDFVAHVTKFWDPRMRQDLIRIMRGPESASAHEMVRRAVRDHACLIMGTSAAQNTGG
ncbi:MAG: formate dehydrogenase [Burkholderiaceae bacterium]|nr:formate dehydrogenase [Burkholderiaceae bacterium]